jgi:hypothetical protein
VLKPTAISGSPKVQKLLTATIAHPGQEMCMSFEVQALYQCGTLTEIRG